MKKIYTFLFVFLFGSMVFASTYSNIVEQSVVNNNNGTITISFKVCSNTSNGQGVGVEANYNTNTFQQSADNLTFLSNGYMCTNGPGSLYSVQITLPSSATNITFQSFSSDYGTINNRNSFSGFGSILPVSFGKIAATQIDNIVKLQWEIFSEQNHDYYEAQRSYDGISWVSFANFKTLEERSKVKIYEELDIKPFNGTNYYRIKQVDIDGTISYSKTVSVLYQDLASKDVLFSNPIIGNTLELQINNKLADKILVIDQLGRKLIYKSLKADDINSVISLPFENHPKGIYILAIQDKNGKIISRKNILKL